MREFERKIGAVCRAVAVRVAEKEASHKDREEIKASNNSVNVSQHFSLNPNNLILI